MKGFLLAACLAGGMAMAQTGGTVSSLNLSDLPSAEAKPKIPALEEPAPTPDLSKVQPSENPSIPQLRPAEPPKEKAQDEDWAAQAMLKKREESKKRQEEEAALAAQKAREAQEALAKEKEAEKKKAARDSTQPMVTGPATPGLNQGDASKLPVVTGMEGVKPRAMATGDGRVQPAFDSFTGPASTGPLGRDFQSGAKPIMPGTTAKDGRMEVPPQPPSGAYKRISQDPFSLPSGYGQKNPVAVAPPPRPVNVPANPPTGDTKRAINDTRAGLSPYDSMKKVPDPRSQRRF